jgi:hypothetical protein
VVETIRKFGVVAKALVLSSLFAAVFVTETFAYTGVEYQTESSWATGTVTSVSDNGTLVPASVSSIDYVGVVAKPSEDGAVEVANSGVVSALVTDKDGEIASGSRVGLSSVAGVASLWSNGTVIGVAQEAPANWQTATLSSSDTVRVASIKIQLLTDGASTGSSAVNEFFAALEKTASGVAGKPVDTWRIITALLIGLGGLILAFGLLFISSRESFFSMGRNPMASKVIMRGLWKVVALSVGILCVTLTAAYLIVRIS